MKFICGPMATISHPGFRHIVEQFGGCDEYYTEMINAGTLLTKGPFEKFYLVSSPVPEKLVWQLTGKNPELMIEAARELVLLDGIGIDLNMGCSAPDIYRFGAGIAWMLKDTTETEAMVKGVGRVIEEYNKTGEYKKRFSVKLRLGDDDFTDEKFFDFCKMLLDNGVELLCLHPRTKKEKLTRTPRYIYCNKLKELSKNYSVPVYLNGNIRNIEDVDYALSQAPEVDGIMISRMAVQKPWIFKELKMKNEEGECKNTHTGYFSVDLLKLANDFIDGVEEFQPPEFYKTRLQRFFTYYSLNFKFSHYAQTQFLNAQNNQDLRERLLDFFEKCPEERMLTIR